MKKGKAIPILQIVKADKTVTSLNSLTDDVTVLSNDNANIQVTTEGQAIKIDSSQVSANKADITTNFNKYLAGIQNDGTCNKNNDCNNTVVNGRWYSNGTKNDPNAPTGSNGILETYRGTTESVYQKYTPYTSANTSINLFYQRSGTDVSTKVVWSEWIKFSTEQTATNTAAIATNKTDIATNFNKYLEGYDADGNFDKSIDCNKSINNGTWYCPTSTLNIPAECVDINASGYLEVTRATTLSLRQIFTPYGDSHSKKNLFWIRTAHDSTKKFADDTFEPWVKFGSFDQYLAGIQNDGTCSGNNDCNNALVNGRWFSEGKPNDPNAPTTANGILETYRPTSGSLYQRYTPYTADSYIAKNLFHQRRGSNVNTEIVWSEWVEFSTTINGLIVGTLLWNDTTAKAMGSNMMPASGIHYLDPVIFPELFEKIGYSKGRKGDLFKVGISTSYPFISLVRSNHKVGFEEPHAMQDHRHATTSYIDPALTTEPTTFRKGTKHWTYAWHGGAAMSTAQTTGLASEYGMNVKTGTNTHPNNTACYLNRITSTVQNEALEQALKDTSLLTVRCIATKDNLEGFAENELMGEMEVPFNYHTTQWHYDNENEDSIIIDKVEYWVSESQTKVEPLETKKGFTQLFKNDKFEYIEDRRKEEVYLKTDGSLFTITELGEIPNEYTTIAPPTYAQYYKFNTDKWVLDSSKKNELIEVLWTSLSEKRDYITDKLFEYKGYNININKDSKDDLHDLYLDASDAKMELTLLSQISNRTPEQEAEYQNLLKWEVVWICNKIELTDDVKVDTELKLTLNDAIALDQLRRKYRSNEVFDIHNIQITLKNKTMEELIDLLNTKEVVI